VSVPVVPPVGAGSLERGVPVAVARVRNELQRRGIDSAYCADGAAAVEYLLSRIPAGATVMNGGSTTLKQIGFLAALEKGRYEWLRPRITAVNDAGERTRMRRRATTADYFIGGINALTAGGEILNADGSGNRLAAYAFGAGKVFLVAGVNKIVPDLVSAFERLRNEAALQECRHLGKSTPCALTGRCDNDACRGPERQCGKVLIIENERIPGRMCVVIVGETLGY
jgi:L-lactate utilization protein LutB